MKKFLSVIMGGVFLLAITPLLISCEEFGMESNPTPSYISLNTSDVTLKVGDTFVRKAIVAGTAVVIYSSSNDAVATVDQAGKVTAVGEGTATITATATGYDAAGKKIYQPASVSYVITITPATVAVTSLTLNKPNLRFDMSVPPTAQALTATVAPDDATDKTVTWTSSDTNVATVDASGNVTPVAKGTTTITATAGDKTATSTVYIYDKIVDINTVSANVTVTAGESWLINGNGTEVAYSITIGAGAKATLNGISINPSGNDPGISCSSTGNSTIILADGSTNTVDKTGNFYAAGIQVGGAGTTLTIEAETAGTGKLTAKGANSSYGGAGIGTNGAQYTAPTQVCGNIIIKGGIIDAQGGIQSAGIGTGVANSDGAGIAMTQTCGTITITGGTVTASGGNGAAGIGTGNADGTSSYSVSQTCSDITIGAGVTKVTATKGFGSPNSIGAGKKDDYGTQTCGTISIADPSKVTQN